MGDTDLRLSFAIGWLVRQLAQAQGRSEAQVAADLFSYLEQLDALRPPRS